MGGLCKEPGLGAPKLSADLVNISRVNKALRSSAQEYLYHFPSVKDFSLWSLIKILLSDPDRALQIREVHVRKGVNPVFWYSYEDGPNMIPELCELVRQTTPPHTRRCDIEEAIGDQKFQDRGDRPQTVQDAIFIATLLGLAPNLESAQFH